MAPGWWQKRPLHAFLINTPTKNCVYFLERKNIESCQSKLLYVYNIYIYIYKYIFFFNRADNGVSACVFRYQMISMISQSTITLLQENICHPKIGKAQRTLKKPHTCSCQISILH